MEISENVREKVLNFQRTEITEYHIYRRLAKIDWLENATYLREKKTSLC